MAVNAFTRNTLLSALTLIALQVHEELPLAYQKRLIVDSKTELAFESNGPTKKFSRILSHPSKAPRGKKGDVYLDELAHYVNDREVYRGSTALILRSNGQLTGCSTPLGRRGIFWEIANEELRKYPHHTRQHVPWWLCRFFTTDVKAASQLALDRPFSGSRCARSGLRRRVAHREGGRRRGGPSTLGSARRGWCRAAVMWFPLRWKCWKNLPAFRLIRMGK